MKRRIVCIDTERLVEKTEAHILVGLFLLCNGKCLSVIFFAKHTFVI